MKNLKLFSLLIIFSFTILGCNSCANDKKKDNAVDSSDSTINATTPAGTTVPNGGGIDSDDDPKDCIPLVNVSYKPEGQEESISGSVLDTQVTESISMDSTYIEPVPDNSVKRHYKRYTRYRLKDPKNTFDTSEDNIHLEIPVSNRKLWIKDVINVSEYNSDISTNAILVLLYPSDGIYKKTDSKAVKLILSDLKISKIDGLRKDILKRDKKLKVFIYYDDKVTDCTIDFYRKCVRAKSNYNSISCIFPWKPGEPIPAPKEQGGDVIGGG